MTLNKFRILTNIKYPEYKKYHADVQYTNWSYKEIEHLSQDNFDFYNKLNKDEQTYIKNVLFFFSISDKFINDNIAENFIKEIDEFFIDAIYKFQIHIETIHIITYNILLEGILNESDKLNLFNTTEAGKLLQEKIEWAEKWKNSKENLKTRIVAFACFEGIFFCSSFAAIFWIKSKGIMPKLCLSNEFISRDESIHTDFGCKLFHDLPEPKPDDSIVKAIIQQAVDIEINFTNNILPNNLLNINKELMNKHVKAVADDLCLKLIHTRIYNEITPLEFMKNMSLEGKTNFFEKSVTEYQKYITSNDEDFSINEDF